MSADPGQAMARLLRDVSATIGTIRASAEVLDRTDWASVTFSGARHRLCLVLEGPGAVGAAADFLARMPELELPIPGHIVADIALVAEERREGYARLELEALTVEDA